MYSSVVVSALFTTAMMKDIQNKQLFPTHVKLWQPLQTLRRRCSCPAMLSPKNTQINSEITTVATIVTSVQYIGRLPIKRHHAQKSHGSIMFIM